MFLKSALFDVSGSMHSGMLTSYWLPDDLAKSLALPGGQPWEELHLTLCYSGDVSSFNDIQIANALLGLAAVASHAEPLPGMIAGIGRFNASESSDGKDVVYANVDVPGLEGLQILVRAVLESSGITARQDHGYTPHITLAYIDPGAEMPVDRLPRSLPINIDCLCISIGERRLSLPFAGGKTEGTAMSDEPYKGNALKALDIEGSEIRVGNYLALWEGRDLEGIITKRVNPDGSKGEFFTKNTQFDSPYTDLGFLYVDWEHGKAPVGEPDADDVLGFVDWKSAKIDDKGLFVERVLNRRNRYIKFLEELLQEKMIGTSSEAISQGVRKARNGEIIRWPLRRDTLTVNPMEPRMMTQNSISAIKGLSQRLPALKSVVDRIEYSRRHEIPRSKATVEVASSMADSRIVTESLLLELDLLLL